MKVEVFTACHEVPPETSDQAKTPEPFVCKNWSASPSVAGKVKVTLDETVAGACKAM